MPTIHQFCSAAASIVLHVGVLTLVAHDTMILERSETITAVQPLIATVLLFDKSAASEGLTEWSAPALTSAHTIKLPIPLLTEIDPVAADSFDKSRQAENLGDVETIARLQGIYVTQINARLARVLEMAGVERNAESAARCVVHVIQDERGEILDIDMDECEREDGDRQRLMSAIRAASPLPFPPDGLAMGSYITLDASSL
jgi:hypothetical protein